MKINQVNNGWLLLPSSDGKRHFITNPNKLAFAIEVDTDDYDIYTEPHLLKLLDILANSWDG